MQQSNRFFLLLITFVAALGGLLFGFDMAVISGVLPFVREQFSLSPLREGWFVSSALVGCIAGVAFSGELSDRLGRKKMLLLSAVLFLLSAIGACLAPGFSFLVISRIAGGLGVGIASSVAPLYISEISPARIRGRLVTFYQLAITLGILAAYLSNAGLHHYAAGAAVTSEGFFAYVFNREVWRGMFGVGAIPSVLFLLGLALVPESPRWLFQKGRKKEAMIILEKISGPGEARQVTEAAAEIKVREGGSYRELLKPGMRKALLIGILLPFFSQFSGINAVIYYGPSILNEAGIDLSNALLGQIILGGANVVFTLLAIWKVDQLGRRPLYLFGTAGAAVSLFSTGLCFYLGATGSWLLLLSALLFLGCFAFSIGPIKFVVASEIFPNHIRGRALAISIMTMWVADTIVGQLTPLSLERLGTAVTFWVFAGFCLVAWWVGNKLLPETKGKTLEEIQEIWRK
ncbi:sugar porter (SP) family MFS transporter [Anseongella ginsenosidimutans]|uniref:Sugar porter (SP) family MFS transporter n=1 Tax=Anseongella ginsenosidimutans TaxID=496056 RepID=A0A4V2UTT8_9SPHI|nr:sugar porter family MFS transporter [Anseongella ginsenosidimutans]QEC53100.1 sugar porter family MFS transporter [Anseongella ginsenosidimutans]TCS87718.1 sugar porter (SP) family MFS transporter [Anseongella ginsenosidimutans]